MTEIKINSQPNIVYIDANMRRKKILVRIGIKAVEVNRRWVTSRTASAMDSVLVPVGINNVS